MRTESATEVKNPGGVYIRPTPKRRGDYEISNPQGLGKYVTHLNEALRRIGLEVTSRFTEVQRSPDNALFIFSNPEVQVTKSGIGQSVIFQIEYGEDTDGLYTTVCYRTQVQPKLSPKEGFSVEYIKYGEPMMASELDQKYLPDFLEKLELQFQEWWVKDLKAG